MNQLSYQPEDQAAENAFKRKMRPPTSKCEIIGMSSKIHNQQLKCAQNKGTWAETVQQSKKHPFKEEPKPEV